jgi:hypothetical protein
LSNNLHPHKKSIFGSNNTSVKDGYGLHAWILSTGSIDNIVDPSCPSLDQALLMDSFIPLADGNYKV